LRRLRFGPALSRFPAAMRARAGASAQLLERDAERRQLEHAVTEATDRRPRLLVIEGSAGIGKTRLLEELSDLGLAAGMAVRWARGIVLEQPLAWSVVRQLLTQPLLDLAPGSRASMLERAAARAPAILGLDNERATTLQFSEALHAVYWLTVELSQQTPLLLIVDDVQWADRESIGYLNYLGNRLDDQAILLVVAIRTGDPESQRRELDEMRLIPGQVTLSPQPLSRPASDEVVVRRLGELAQPAVCRRIYDATSGNPFLLHELCRGFEPDRALADAAKRAEATAAERISLSVFSRLTRYPTPATEVAEAAAVLGGSATLSRVSRLIGTGGDGVANVVGQLLEAEILAHVDHTIGFVHPLVRRAVYERVNAARRQVLHDRAAKLLREDGAPAGEIAAHLLHATPAAEAWRVAHLRQAAAETLAVGAPESAATYLRRALIEPPREEEMYELLLELGRSELHHDPRAAVDSFSRAHKLAASTEAQCAAALLLAQAHSLLGDFTSALTVLHEAMDERDEADGSLRRQLDSARLVFARWDYASQGLRQELFEGLLARAGSGAELDRDERANLAHELAARGENLATAAACARSAIRDSTTLSGTDAAFVLQLTSVLVICDLCDEADEIAVRAVKDAESRGSDVDACAALTLAAYSALRRGDVTEAVERAQSALTFTTGVWNIAAVAWLSEALAEQSEPTRAEALLSQHGLDQLSLTQPSGAPLGYQFAVLVHHRARMRALAGQPARALDDFLSVGELAKAWRVENPVVLDWRSRAAGVLVALERHDEAAELAKEELRLARRWGATSAIGTALRAVGMADPGSTGTTTLRAAVDVHAGAPTRLEYARSLVALGTRLRRERQQLEARELLRKGLDVAFRRGGVLVANQARDELVAAGGKPRRDAIQGAEALTGRERRIAELAVQGLTNRQIAQTLFLSARTVEHHLRNIYRKLGIRGRDELESGLERS
jgi:DNA-binding CsgD family transcriptional regulator